VYKNRHRGIEKIMKNKEKKREKKLFHCGMANFKTETTRWAVVTHRVVLVTIE